MPPTRILVLTLLAMIAFSGNSLLCRLALQATSIDPATFTTVRLCSGAIMLWLLSRWPRGQQTVTGNWRSAIALFIYAAGFSFAYVNLSAGTGALLLFGAVQVTMISYGFWRGERPSRYQLLGFIAAFGGLVFLLLPGLSTPPLLSSGLMLGAGIAWGIYSLRGKGARDPLRMTGGNFIRAVPLTLVLSAAGLSGLDFDWSGVGFAIASGALASGCGYTLWYLALEGLSATTAATVQLSVPVLAAVGGLLFLSEPLTPRLLIASLAILGGIAIVILAPRRP